MSFRRQQNEWTEFLRRYAAELRGRLGRAAAVIDRARTQPKQMLDGRGAEGKAFHRQRDEWIEFLRRHTTELRGHIVRRFRGPAVRARFGACVFIGQCAFAVALLIVSLVVHTSTFKAFRRQWGAWTEFLRECVAERRGCGVRIVRRLWGPAVRGRFWACVLIGWCGFAATLLIVSLVVHTSTFLGIDPMAKWPGVMFIHLAIFPPFIAALYYASRAGGKGQDGQDKVFKSAPLWLRTFTGVLFVYGLVNFAVFMVLNEGGGPHERDGKYVLTSHGTVLRELSKAEYHRQQAYVVRGFSGHWMMFSCAALTMLVGTAKLRRHSGGTLACLGSEMRAVN